MFEARRDSEKVIKIYDQNYLKHKAEIISDYMEKIDKRKKQSLDYQYNQLNELHDEF